MPPTSCCSLTDRCCFVVRSPSESDSLVSNDCNSVGVNEPKCNPKEAAERIRELRVGRKLVRTRRGDGSGSSSGAVEYSSARYLSNPGGGSPGGGPISSASLSFASIGAAVREV